MKIGFVSVDSRKEIQTAVDFLAKQTLGYPHYDQWVGRAEAELHSGYKRGILGFCDDRLVADIIWQPHKALQGVAEVKNLRIAIRRSDHGSSGSSFSGRSRPPAAFRS